MFGCAPKAKVSEDVVTPEKFADWSFAAGWDKLPQPDWVARTILAVEPPLSDTLINAIADPFRTDETWSKPEGKAERDKLIGELTEWWQSAIAKPNSELPDEDVIGRFSAAIGARILHCRLLELNGNESEAFAMAIETVELINKSLMTSPVLGTNEMFPSALIANENLARLSKSAEVSTNSKKLALKKSVVGLPGAIGGKINRDYLIVETRNLFKQLKQRNLGKAIAMAINPDDASPRAEEVLHEVVGSPETRDFELIAKEAYKTVSALFNPRGSFRDLDRFMSGQSKRMERDWGVDIFNVPIEKWDVEKMKVSYKESKNAVGNTLSFAIAQKYLPYLDSAYLGQMQIDANRIRIAAEIFKSEKGSYPTEFAQLDDYLKGSVLDPITHEPYLVDFKGWTLRTTQEPVDKKFIFVNQAIANGAKI